MKIDRLFGILSVLLECERVSARELAERFEVSQRTIYRDIAALEGAGIPVVTFPGCSGGIGILPGYKLDMRLLSRWDLSVIRAGLAGISSLGGNERSMNTLLARLMPETADTLLLESDIIIDFSGWDNSHFLLRRIGLLRSAIAAERCVQVEYVSPQGRTTRLLEPHKIVFKSSSWYLYAFCRLREDFRLFKLTRMQGLSLAGEAFSPRALESLPLEWREDLPDSGGERVVLRFPAHMEYLVMDMFGMKNYEAAADGSLQVTFFSTDLVGTMYQILAFGPDVEVLECDPLKALLLNWAQSIVQSYQL